MLVGFVLISLFGVLGISFIWCWFALVIWFWFGFCGVVVWFDCLGWIPFGVSYAECLV